jgi:hypothetical protein
VAAFPFGIFGIALARLQVSVLVIGVACYFVVRSGVLSARDISALFWRLAVSAVLMSALVAAVGAEVLGAALLVFLVVKTNVDAVGFVKSSYLCWIVAGRPIGIEANVTGWVMSKFPRSRDEAEG